MTEILTSGAIHNNPNPLIQFVLKKKQGLHGE